MNPGISVKTAILYKSNTNHLPMDSKVCTSVNSFFYRKKVSSIITFFLTRSYFFFLLYLTLHTFSASAQATNTPLSFSQIPLSDPDIASPFRGAYHWNRFIAPWSTSSNQVPLTYTKGQDSYYRFRWSELQTESGIYNWSYFDRWVRNAIDNKAKFSFGIMSVSDGEGYTTVGGSLLDYPLYLHNQMQAEGNNNADWTYDGMWIPNWNSPNYLNACTALLTALRDHINNTSYNGVPFKDVIGYQDIRLYGNWGEWHNYPYEESTPTGRAATSVSLKYIIDAYLRIFPDMHMVGMAAAYKESGSASTPLDVTYHMLNATNNWGKIGWRWDTWGDNDYADIFESNTGSYNGMRFDTAVMNRWKYALVGGEPSSSYAGVSNNGASSAYFRLVGTPRGQESGQVEIYHASLIGNGNYSSTSEAAMRNNIIAASKKMGYRIILEGGNLRSDLSANRNLSISLNWKNIGIAPIYENWNVTFELQDQASNAVRWTGLSSHKLRFWLPASNATVVTDNFIIPDNVAAGTYRLVVKIVDPRNYRDPLPLAIQGRRTDGSYLLKSDIVIGASSGAPNTPPTANAGTDQTISLPTSSVTLNGSGTDTDGTVTEYSWNKISGPGGDLIQASAAAATLITGLVAGIYMYRLTVKDNAGASSTDDIQITVTNPSPPPNSPPFVNAGNDQTITLPANTTTLNGSATDSDGSLASYAWSKISGPAGTTIQTPNTANTNITGLTAGTFVFRLTVTDNSGATGTDDVQVIVNAAPAPAPANQAPLANAGNDINISLPTNSANLSGSGNDPDGSIASFAWTKISGPAGGNIQSANAASTNITGLTAGTYVFRLTVTDNSGATASDDVQIVVSSQPPTTNPAPVANAGADKTITLPANATTLNGTGTDANGTISSYRWSKVSGPAGGNLQSPNAANTNVRGLNAGTYVFRLTVTDNGGLTGTDDVQVLVNTSLAPSPTNQAPVANAGNDIIITLPVNRTTLSGTGSDADGSVSTYNWSKISGPTGGNIQSPSISNTEITGLAAGTYIFRLTVTDNSGAQSTDDIQITVSQGAPSPTGNQAPTANAGVNQNISLPANSVALTGSGSDVDGSIVSYSWAKVSGPAAGNIQSPNAASTNISGLVEGTYAFRLTVTDNAGATATDDVQVIVSPTSVAPNQLPIANAGKDISITLPVNSVVLNSAASVDPDGNIVGFNWRKVQGPNGSSIANSGTATPTINGLARGTHEFEVTVTDNRGGTATDRVIINVLKINQKPVALSARDTINVSLPVQNAELNATNSYDPDGTITNYQWTFKNGPKEPKMLAPQASRTIITDLVAGTYEYDLEVTDDEGEKSVKSLVVIVKNSSNRRLIPNVSAYPNPATDIVNVKIDSEVEGRTTLTFIDMNGRPAMTDVFVKGPNSFIRQVNIARLPKGTYAILVQVDQTEKVVEKIVKF